MMAWKFSKYPDNWKELSAKCKKRDGYRCQDCGTTKRPLYAHHILSLSKGGANNLENLKTVCKGCHGKYHSHMPTSGPSASKGACPKTITITSAKWQQLSDACKQRDGHRCCECGTSGRP